MKSLRRTTHASVRRGLAPMELVLSLPVMLMAMALMVTFGTAAAWKVRVFNGARLALWRTRVGWNGSNDPKLESLPRSATMSSRGGPDLTMVGNVWDIYPITHPLARGPRVTGEGHNGESGTIVLRDRRYLEMQDGALQGTSHLERRYAMMPKGGRFTFDVTDTLLDSRWQYSNQGYPANDARRAKGWYNFEDDAQWASEKARLIAADNAIISYPNSAWLKPLDRDEEFLDWYGSYRDFYAIIPHCNPHRPGCGACTTDVEVVRQTVVNPLVDRIKGRRGGGRGGIPDNMASAWISLYQAQINQLQQQQPPDQGRIQQLQDLIDQLNQFRGTLN